MIKKLALCIALGTCSLAYAEFDEKSEVTSKIGYVKAQNKYAVAAGYTNSKLSADAIDDIKFKGYFANFSTFSSVNYSVWFEYAQEKNDEISDAKLQQFSLGMQYRLYDGIRTYAAMGGGLGYAGLKYTSELLDSNGTVVSTASDTDKYLTLPIHVEAGFYAFENVSVFANVGYKWLFSLDENDVQECDSYSCYPTEERASENDLDGFNYKLGVRFHF